LAGTLRTDFSYQNSQGLIREETVVDLNVDVSGPTPVATLVRGQFFFRNSLVSNARFVLADFTVDPNVTWVSVQIEYGDGASYTRTLRR
jgi:hypothetical protein